MNKNKYSVVIPTRNRKKLLADLLNTIDTLDENLIEILIIDSSDFPNETINSKNPKIKYFHSEIKSAAAQRNIGIDRVSKNAEYIFFLDDDVLINDKYFKELIGLVSRSDVIGGSGIAVNFNNSVERKKPKGLVGLYKKLFLLDSNIDGKLMRSAINIPYRKNNKPQLSIMEVDWLIGCAIWKISVFDKLRFEESFHGQSLGEDLLFSHKAKALGKLLVNKDILINHRESNNERPNRHDFYKMWILNRYEISKQLELSPLNLAFHWANFGTFFLNVFKKQNNYSTNLNILNAIFIAYKELLKGKK
jgi:glycosyltransferase involved in cell wall biosynthesis